ncbi:MAG: DNA mismatch repair protein MutS [Balneolaceae bacterium]
MSTTKKKQTPLMRQYFDIKETHPGTILLFRVGDFYETFSDDAELVSRELGITLTKRNNGGDQTPLAGFPYHALETYLPKLVERGYRVAVCEQTENPDAARKAGRKIVDREVTEITTPGITMSEKLLDHKHNNYIAAVHWSGGTAGVAFCDISTGEFALCQISGEELVAFFQSLSPSEVLIRKSMKGKLPDGAGFRNITFVEDWVYEGDYGYKQLTGHFRTHSLKGFGVEGLTTAHVAAGSLLHYMQETNKSSLNHLRKLYAYENADYMALDGSTKRNLELAASLREGRADGTLVSILDYTRTAMGGRLLRKWIMRPLKELSRIKKRLDAVEMLYSNHRVREELREVLKDVSDLERLIARISVGRTNARDLKQLERSLERMPSVKACFSRLDDPVLADIVHRLDPLPDLGKRISAAITEDPPAGIRDGGIIRDGFDDKLDELRDIARNGKDYIAQIKNKLTKETGITSLKIGYNKVFGYYIEITNTHKDKVPEQFIRKQTLVNSERYITPELKEVEEKVLSAEDRSKLLEADLFEEVRIFTAEFADQVQEVAGAVAELDCLQGFAEVSYRNNYARPEVNDGEKLLIRKGRHPVVERSLPAGEPFIPNDIILDSGEYQILIITGPNMAGKSIILRQTGLIVLMAQAGCFVPAQAAEIGLVDKIFTRVGASDNPAAGESTFLVEMNEAANILNNATPRSLVLFDEVGRGTSTFDGLSIAWSLVEYLHNKPEVAAKTLFATHYHELNELENLYGRIKNFNVRVKEHEGKVIFLRKLVRGGADHSYGIQVADMAGLPRPVIDRAREILVNLEKHSLDITNSGGDGSGDERAAAGDETAPSGTGEGSRGRQQGLEKVRRKKEAAVNVVRDVEKQDHIPQMSLFEPKNDPELEMVIDRLEAADPDRMTPVEALTLLCELKRLTGK